eukprot:77892_1
MRLRSKSTEHPHIADTECILCWEGVSDEHLLVVLKCGHEFCVKCVLKYEETETTPLCPLWRLFSKQERWRLDHCIVVVDQPAYLKMSTLLTHYFRMHIPFRYLLWMGLLYVSTHFHVFFNMPFLLMYCVH